MIRAKPFSIVEEENPQRKEWCYGEKEQKFLDDCKVTVTADGLSAAEMIMISAEFRRILKDHGYDVTVKV
jgi:hypothetical protein